MVDRRQPVLVGVAQVEQRTGDPLAAREPLALMVEAVTGAADDAGSRGLLAAVDSVRVIRGMWPYSNPARAIAERIGAPRAETGMTALGGNHVQAVLNQSALDIVDGRRDVVVITGAECGRTQGQAAKAKIELAWSQLPGTPDVYYGSDRYTRHPAELALAIERPIQYYPLFENALRFERGESIAEHQERISELWSRFSRVAADNPHAWIRRVHSAETIRTPSQRNRRISFPYTKLMNSNLRVDQGAALIVCSVAAAARHGVPADRLVYPLAGADAYDSYYVSNRDDLHSSPAIRIAGRRVLELAGVEASDLDFVDLYSCFPSAVQVAAEELGLGFERDLTVTGGMTFAGGPLNNYVMHAIATTVERLRARPGATGLVTANGGLLTKHSFGVYSTAPTAAGFRHQNLQPEVDRMPTREVSVDHRGPVTIETYTVMYGTDGPTRGHAACLLDDGRRAWGVVHDPVVLEAMAVEEQCGRRARRETDGTLDLGG